MSIKRSLTAMAVDSARDYLQEKLDEVKQLDLDQDGRKDVDQVTELLAQLAERVKDSIESTDFPKLASGFEQVMTGFGLISESIDRQKVGAALEDMGTCLRQLGVLVKLGVAEIKNQDK